MYTKLNDNQKNDDITYTLHNDKKRGRLRFRSRRERERENQKKKAEKQKLVWYVRSCFINMRQCEYFSEIRF